MAGKRKQEYISKDFVLFLLEYYGNMLTWSKEDVLGEIKAQIAKEPTLIVEKTVACNNCVHMRKLRKGNSNKCWCEVKSDYTPFDGFCPYGEKREKQET